MAADDEDDTGKLIDNSGLTPKPQYARTGAPVPPGVAAPSPAGGSFTFTGEVFGIGTMLPQSGGGAGARGKNGAGPPPDNRPFFNPTGDAEVDAHYKDEFRLTREGERIHTQLDKDNRIDAQGRDLDASSGQYATQHSTEVGPDETRLDRFNAPSEAGSPPDENRLDRFNDPGARQAPDDPGPSPGDDGPLNLSDEFNRRSGPGGR